MLKKINLDTAPIDLGEGKVYFASDFHLGVPTHAKSKEREYKIIAWLQEIRKDAKAIILVGDIFDFWFEYKTVVPKGYINILGELASIKKSGVEVYSFVGNHDLWMNGYFEQEMNIPVFHEPSVFLINGKKVFVGHGDGLGPGDKGFKALKKIFTNKLCQWMFRQIHPDLGIRIANYWSRKSRMAIEKEAEQFLGEEKEWLIVFAKEILKQKHFDYFIFGHRHLPLEIELSQNSTYINLGDWINHYTYGFFNGKELKLEKYNK